MTYEQAVEFFKQNYQRGLLTFTEVYAYLYRNGWSVALIKDHGPVWEFTQVIK